MNLPTSKKNKKKNKEVLIDKVDSTQTTDLYADSRCGGEPVINDG